MGRDLVVVEPDLEIGLEKEMLILRRQGTVIRRSRLQDLEQLILLGRQELTAAARQTLLRQGIDVVFLTGHGQFLGRLQGRLSANGPLRLAQYRVCAQPEAALGLAKAIVHGKVTNQRRLLLRQQREYQRDDIAGALAGMRRMLALIEGVTEIPQLMGVEGQAAACYFGIFGALIRQPDIHMQGRSRRPPRDPVNAALSFGYSILTRLVETTVHQVGLDPYLGFLHQPRQGLPALVLDLVEEFRPVLVDSLILRLFNRSQLQAGDFHHPKAAELAEQIFYEGETPDAQPDLRPPVYLNETGRRIFFQGWYDRLRQSVMYAPQQRQLTYADVIRMQAYHLARVLMQEEERYLPYVQR